jgi:hypothetical protein
MADDLGYTPGTGAQIKTDQGGTSGAHMQVIKIAESADGGETLIPATADDGLLVKVSSIDSDVSIDGPVAVTQSGTWSVAVSSVPNPITVSGTVGISGTPAVSGTVTANQGTPATNANAWPTQLTDGSGNLIAPAKPLAVKESEQGFTRVSKAVTVDQTASDLALWTPASGKKFVVLSAIIEVSSTTSGLLKIYDDTNAAANMLYQGTPAVGCRVIQFPKPWVSAAANNVLRASAGGDALSADITLFGYEI